MEQILSSPSFNLVLIIVSNIALIFAISLLLSRVTLIFGELLLFGLLALWVLWGVVIHAGSASGVPTIQQLSLVMLLLVVVFSVNHYRLSKQTTPPTTKDLGWYVRYRFFLVLKVAVLYAVVVMLLGTLLPQISPVITIVVAATAAVYWDKIRVIFARHRM